MSLFKKSKIVFVWDDIPLEYKRYIIFSYIKFVFFLIVMLFIAIGTKLYSCIPFFLLLLLYYGGKITYNLQSYMTGNVISLQGECININIKNSKGATKKLISESSYIYIKSGNMSIKISAPYIGFEEGNEIKVYTMKDNIEFNNNICIVNSPILVVKINQIATT